MRLAFCKVPRIYSSHALGTFSGGWETNGIKVDNESGLKPASKSQTPCALSTRALHERTVVRESTPDKFHQRRTSTTPLTATAERTFLIVVISFLPVYVRGMPVWHSVTINFVFIQPKHGSVRSYCRLPANTCLGLNMFNQHSGIKETFPLCFAPFQFDF